MIRMPMDVQEAYPIRKSKKQKRAFREDVSAYLTGLGYVCREEKGSLGSRNVIAGDPEQARFLVTAHYDTCAAMPVPNLLTPCNLFLYLGYQLLLTAGIFAVAIAAYAGVLAVTQSRMIAFQVSYLLLLAVCICITVGPANRHNANDNTSGVVTVLEIARSLPENLRSRVCFVLFDMEELGMIGSASYRKAHKKATDRQILLNLDCVGDGDELLFVPSGKLKRDRKRICSLKACEGTFGHKRISVRDKGLTVYPSDQLQFPLGVGIAAFHRSPWAGLYMSRIHTKRDTVLQITNVNILRACLISLMGRTDD